MLKAEPLSVEEVNLYGGVGTANNHVNMYLTNYTTASYYQTAYDNNGYGGMQYYSSATCTGYGDISGCRSDYASSEVKYVVDAWKTSKSPTAIEARLITIDELKNFNYGEEQDCGGGCKYVPVNENVLPWVYNSNYTYWTMSSLNDLQTHVWDVNNSGILGPKSVELAGGTVRPVITLKKTALGDIDESIVDDIEKEDTKIDAKDNIDDNKSNESKTIVKVANTYMSSSIIIIILGFIIASISVFVLYRFRNKSIK